MKVLQGEPKTNPKTSKVTITAEVNEIRHYDMIRVEVEVPEDATPEKIRELLQAKVRELRSDPEIVPSVECRYAYAYGNISDLEGLQHLSDEEYMDLLDSNYGEGDEEAML